MRVRCWFLVTSSLALLFGIVFAGYSQPSSINTYSLSEANGLSDDRVTCIFLDHQGFLWIGTEDGLNRYDGSAFKIFKRKDEGSGQIAGNFIHCITEDENKHLWIGTGNGLSEYDPLTNSFQTFRSEASGASNDDHDVVRDKHENVWVATATGLLEWVPGLRKFVSYLNPSGIASDNRVNKIIIDKQGRFWLATFGGLWRFYPDEDKFEKVVLKGHSAESNAAILNIAESHDGTLWFGYWGEGVLRFDPETGITRRTECGYFNVRGIAEVMNPKGKYDVWFGNLLRVDDKGALSSFTLHVPLPQENYKTDVLYSSGNGLLCMGSDKGVMILDLSNHFFSHQYLSSREITHQEVSLFEDKARLYVGGDGDNFLTAYDSVFHPAKRISFNKKLLPSGATTNPSVLSIAKEDQNKMWLCTEEGLILLDKGSGQQKLFRLAEKECAPKTRNFISSIFIDRQKKHWLFPWRAGIWQFDLTQNKFTRMIDGLTTEGKKTKNFVVVAAIQDTDDHIWFADLDEGLIRFDARTKVFSKVIVTVPGWQYTLANIVFDAPYLWCATTGVVFRVHETSRSVEKWPIPEELNKTVTGFCSDHQGNLWITTRNGLLSFNKTSHQFQRFTVNNGLVNNVMEGTLFCTNSGRMLYADKNYVTAFDPRELARKPTIPPVLITAILSQNQVLETSVIDKIKSVDLDYSFNNFTFEWGVLNYRNPFQNRYYCKFEGVDSDWKYVGNVGRAQYASVVPGRYVFRVRGGSSEGNLNEVGDFMIVTIHPPFWRSGWFFGSVVLLFAAAIYLLYRYQLGEALKRERMRNNISADLHDEIGSALSSISIMSELVVRQTAEAKTSEVAKEIRENTILLMERMDDIVWSINPKNDSLEDLLLRIRPFAAHVLEARGISYSFFVDPGIWQLKLTMDVRQHIYLILKEAINNLVKYSGCTEAVVEVKRKDDSLELTVKDNGKGFDNTKPSQGNGLLNMRSRARMMNTQLSIISDKANGTMICLVVKIK